MCLNPAFQEPNVVAVPFPERSKPFDWQPLLQGYDAIFRPRHWRVPRSSAAQATLISSIATLKARHEHAISRGSWSL